MPFCQKCNNVFRNKIFGLIFRYHDLLAILNELEREMPSLTPEEQLRIEAELARVKHEALEITTPPSPFRLDPAVAEVGSIGDGDQSGASDDGDSLNSGYAGAIC